MNKSILNILNLEVKEDEKIKKLNELADEIEWAKKIVSGEFKKCKCCNDYYLTKSFFEETEEKKTRICTYSDPINSGGNDYADGVVRITYEVCPKGHKNEIDRKESLY